MRKEETMGWGVARVGDYVDIVRGSYRGKHGYVCRITMWKMEVKLECGHDKPE